MDKFDGGVKFDLGKLRLDLIPFEVFLGLGWVYTGGAEKYEDNNWKKGMSWMRIVGAILRHFIAWLLGFETDDETGLNHLDHVHWGIVALRWYSIYKKKFDDRPKVQKRYRKIIANLLCGYADKWIKDLKDKKYKAKTELICVTKATYNPKNKKVKLEKTKWIKKK